MARLKSTVASVEKGGPLDLDKILKEGPPKNRIYLAGIELEGLWDDPLHKLDLVKDTSVTVPSDPGMKAPKTGELFCSPMIPSEALAWVKKFYPNKVDASCGMHVHVSFKNAYHYTILINKAYQDTVLHYFTRWAKDEGFPPGHHIWNRLNGKSVYCKNVFCPEVQLKEFRKRHNRDDKLSRYTVINYCFKTDDKGTLECRLLPMMETKQQAVRAIEHFFNITNACLIALAEKDELLMEEFTLPRGITDRTFI